MSEIKTTPSAVETRYLLTINLEFELERFSEPTPYGGRRFVHSGTGSFEGDGLKGTVVPGAFGWTLVRSDGVWEINVRVVLRPTTTGTMEFTQAGRACAMPRRKSRKDCSKRLNRSTRTNTIFASRPISRPARRNTPG
jgi:Protein of unknown function (DUF3237)